MQDQSETWTAGTTDNSLLSVVPGEGKQPMWRSKSRTGGVARDVHDLSVVRIARIAPQLP